MSSGAMSIPVFAAVFLLLRGRSTHSEALCPIAPQFLQAPCEMSPMIVSEPCGRGAVLCGTGQPVKSNGYQITKQKINNERKQKQGKKNIKSSISSVFQHSASGLAFIQLGRVHRPRYTNMLLPTYCYRRSVIDKKDAAQTQRPQQNVNQGFDKINVSTNDANQVSTKTTFQHRRQQQSFQHGANKYINKIP